MAIISNFPSGKRYTNLQSISLEPSTEDRTIIPDEQYDGFSKAILSRIPSEYKKVYLINCAFLAVVVAKKAIAGNKIIGVCDPLAFHELGIVSANTGEMRTVSVNNVGGFSFTMPASDVTIIKLS